MIIVEMTTPENKKINDFSSNIVYAMDMFMLTQCSGGKERSFSQIKNLAGDSGFVLCEIKCHAYSYCIIELHK